MMCDLLRFLSAPQVGVCIPKTETAKAVAAGLSPPLTGMGSPCPAWLESRTEERRLPSSYPQDSVESVYAPAVESVCATRGYPVESAFTL
jgi:hypothetical protein